MKTLRAVAIFALGLVLLAGGEYGALADSVSLTAASPATLDKKGKLELNGSGFTPNTEVTLVFVTDDGVESDIGYALGSNALIRCRWQLENNLVLWSFRQEKTR